MFYSVIPLFIVVLLTTMVPMFNAGWFITCGSKLNVILSMYSVCLLVECESFTLVLSSLKAELLTVYVVCFY